MATRSHKILQSKAAGRSGAKEVPLPSGRRLDARSPTGILTEVERSRQGIPKAVNKLREGLVVGTGRKVRLTVRPEDTSVAFDEMRKQRVRGQIVPIGKPRQSVYVPKRRKLTRY